MALSESGEKTKLQNTVIESIEAMAERLYTDERLSHREVIDRLEVQGVSRAAAVDVVQRMARRRQLDSTFTAPLIFFVVVLLLFLWSWFVPDEANTLQFRTLKGLVQAVSGVAILPLFVVVAYKTYDLIPGLPHRAVASIVEQQIDARPEIQAVESAYLAGKLTDGAAESQLVTLLGRNKGKQRFLALRNHRYFGVS